MQLQQIQMRSQKTTNAKYLEARYLNSAARQRKYRERLSLLESEPAPDAVNSFL